MTTLRLYVSSNLDGILICPEMVIPDTNIHVPDSRRRVFIAGDPNIRSFTTDQLNAVIDLAYRNPIVRKTSIKAIFYSVNALTVNALTVNALTGQDQHEIILEHTWNIYD